MKRLHKPGMLIMYLMITFCLLFLPDSATAQRDKDIDAIINELTINYSNKIETALKKDLPRYNKMKSEAEEVSKIKDNEGKKKGMDNYANAHKQHYGNKVKEAGVDLKSLLINLEKKYPDYLFTITDDFSVLFEKKIPKTTSSGDVGNSSSGINNDAVFALNTQHDLSPATLFHRASMTTTTIPLTFTKSKDIDCYIGSGGAVEFGTRSVKSSSTAVVAGECMVNGNLHNSTPLASAGVTSIKLKLNFSLEVGCYAVGVLVASAAIGNSSCSVKIDGQNNYIIADHIEKAVFAPLLWVASSSQSKSFTYNPDLTAWKGKTLKINGNTGATSMSIVCCATNGFGKLSITSASLTVTN